MLDLFLLIGFTCLRSRMKVNCSHYYHNVLQNAIFAFTPSARESFLIMHRVEWKYLQSIAKLTQRPELPFFYFTLLKFTTFYDFIYIIFTTLQANILFSQVFKIQSDNTNTSTSFDIDIIIFIVSETILKLYESIAIAIVSYF